LKVIYPQVQAFLATTHGENSESLEALRKKALENHVPIIDRDVESFLKFMIRAKGVREILEIGTGVAYSTLVFAETLEKGRIVTLERNSLRAEEAGRNIEAYQGPVAITLIQGEALESLQTLEGPFDLIFIDGGKSHYRAFFEAGVRLLAPGGMIISDNVFYQGRIFPGATVARRNRTSTRAMQQFLLEALEPPRHSVVLPLGDGLLLSLPGEKEVCP